MENKLKITYRKIDKIIPYINNTKKHSQNQIDKIKASIKEFGMCNPILMYQDVIIAGHGRFEALKQLDYKEVPTISLDHLTDNQRKAYIIADNRIGEFGEWDNDLLALELQELKESDLGFDVDAFEFELDIEEFNDEDDFEPDLPSGDREPIRNMTFTVSDEQHELIEQVIKKAKDFSPQDPAGINENGNGNSLYYICEFFNNKVD